MDEQTLLCRVYRDRDAELQQSYANFVIPSKSSLFHSSSHWNDWKKFLRHDRTLGKMFLYFFFNYETIIKSKIDISHVKFQSIVLFLRFFIDIYNPSFFYDYNFWSNLNYFLFIPDMSSERAFFLFYDECSPVSYATISSDMAHEKHHSHHFLHSNLGNQLLKSYWNVNLSLRKNVESYKTYKNQWYRIFKAGNFNLEDDDRSSAPKKFNG